jgi:glucose/arabinose dehydrogenase
MLDDLRSTARRDCRIRWILVATALVTSCAPSAHLPLSAGTGPHPAIPPRREAMVPLVNYVKAKGWPRDASPTVATPDLALTAFARDLDHPRWLYVLPNGDVLVAETNAPTRPDDNRGIKGFFFKFFSARAGGSVPSPNRIVLLRDTDGDGVADVRTVFLSGLHSPFGMALVGTTFYVANTDGVVSFPYVAGETQITAPPTKLLALPAGRINHHWTKNLIASSDGSRLYVTIGSNSNIGENGLEQERDRAAIWEIDAATGRHRTFASGLRNPVGLAWEPARNALWVAVNERDELGSDLVPDYMTAVRDGGFYGWPYSYFGRHPDPRPQPQQPAMIEKAIVPDYALGPHTASLGLAWSSDGEALPARLHGGMFVGQHGSWNRKPRSGYKVIFVPFANGMPSGQPVDVLTGFVRQNGEAMGRPVGVAVDNRGALLVADDVGNAVWRVSGRTTR